MRRTEKNALFRILIDTCVWLDLAKDYQQQALLGVLDELVRTASQRHPERRARVSSNLSLYQCSVH
jgi:hypothetical protein